MNLNSEIGDSYCERLEYADNLKDIWEVVKDSVKEILGHYRISMMLFLDDLPLNLGAYHPVGTNNIVMNRRLMEIVEVATEDKNLVNAFIYNILLHEYLHAIGYLKEKEVKTLILQIAQECFGHDHIVTQLVRVGPWSILKDLPLYNIEGPKRVMEIVKDFEESPQRYIV